MTRPKSMMQRLKPLLLATAAGAGLNIVLKVAFNFSVGDVLSNLFNGWFHQTVIIITPPASPSTEPRQPIVRPTTIYNFNSSPTTNIFNNPTTIYNSPTTIYNSPTTILNNSTTILNDPSKTPADVPTYRSDSPVPKSIVGFDPIPQSPINLSMAAPVTPFFYRGHFSNDPSSPNKPSKDVLISRLPVLPSLLDPEQPPSSQTVEQPQSPKTSLPPPDTEGPPPGFSVSSSSPTDIPEPPEIIATGVAILMLSWFAWHSRRMETAIQAASLLNAKK
jgi:hypothetical protein